jgi:hypothetical protein
MPPASGAIRRAAAPIQSRLQGEDVEDTILPRLHIFQGQQEERQIYGDHKEGDLLNILSGEVIATKGAYPNIVPIFGWNLWIKYKEPRRTGVVYMTRDRSQVPDDDLKWQKRPDGRSYKPAVQHINWVCLLEGHSDPLLFSFKVSSIDAGRTINTLEKQRSAGGKGFGFYGIGLRTKPYSQGSCLVPTIRPLGDPPQEMNELAMALYNSLSGRTDLMDEADETATNVPDAGESDFNPDA